jgi:hypothetical protein
MKLVFVADEELSLSKMPEEFVANLNNVKSHNGIMYTI